MMQALASQAIAAPNGTKLLVCEMDGVDAKAMQEAASSLLNTLGDPAALVLGSKSDGKVNFVAAFSPQVCSVPSYGAYVVTVLHALSIMNGNYI